MKIVIIDDEYPAINEITYMLKKKDLDAAGAFTDPREGYDYIISEKPDVVFLDIDMPYMNGLELGMKIQDNLPEVIIVFITAYPQYALDAFRAYPLDYMLKPIDEERFNKTIGYIYKKLEVSKTTDLQKPFIRCFGKFEIQSGNSTAKFQTQKTKELLAYLICNIDSVIYKDEIINIIFNSGDLKHDMNNFRVTLFRLRNTIKDSKFSKDMLYIHDNCSLTFQNGICDYVDFIRYIDNNRIIDSQNILEAEKIINSINGEFMSDIDTVWIPEIREKLLVHAEELIIKTVLYYINVGRDNKNPENLLLKLIRINPYSEQGYSLLLDLFIKMGDMAKFNYYYRRYEKMLREELGIKPDKKYTSILHNSKV